ncbi:MAG: pilus assembly protein TadG-related protein [Phycisphaeraceae bacterium]
MNHARKTHNFRPRGGTADRRGVVMVVMLLALLLLAGLVFWVINLGRHVNDRMAAQHAVDAAAAGGAGWMARSLNTIAANNTQMARLIAAVAVMDATEEAANFSLTEQQTLRQKLEEHIAAGFLSHDDRRAAAVADLLHETLLEMDEQLAELRSTTAAMDRSGIATATSYQSEGRLWRAIEAADRLNVSLAEQMDAAVRTAAETGGQANLADAAAGTAAVTLLPLKVQPPIARGNFDDFKRPVMQGLLPETEDHRIHARGPWDTLLGWRDLVGLWVQGTEIEGRSRVAHVPRRKAMPVTRAAVEDVTVIDSHFVPQAYRTFGPLEWMLRQVHKHAAVRLGATRMDWYTQRLTDTKIERIWPGTTQEADTPWTTAGEADARGRLRQWSNWDGNQPIVAPDWRTDFEEAQRLAYNDPQSIKETAFFTVEIKSRFPPGHDNFLADGTWAEVRDEHTGNRRLVIKPGWENPREWYNVDMVREGVWEETWDYMVYYDLDVGITGQRNAEGVLQPQPIFRVDHVVFAGVNVGEEAGIRDPFAGLGRDAPAPMRLNTERAGHDDADGRRRYLSVLAVVRRESEAAIWGERFIGGGPTGDMLAIAQARVFNHHSWDLWTQSWRAELEAVHDLHQWVADMRGLTTPGEPQRVYEHLQAVEPLAPLILSH